MVEGPVLILILVAAILFIILLTSKLKLNPFISLLVVSFFVAVTSGIPLNPQGGDNPSPGIISIIASGFGSILTGIGIVILLGTIIGVILEKSGAALKMTDVIVKVVGKKHPALAMSIIGFIVSIPVFCDSGYVIISPLKRALTKRTGVSAVTMSIALSTGLFATHNLVPPTPGPIAAATNIGLSNNLLIIIGLGLLVSIVAATSGLLYSVYIGKKIKSKEDDDDSEISERLRLEKLRSLNLLYSETCEQLLEKYGTLPSGLKSFAPILVPIILMALSSIAKFPGDIFGSGAFKEACVFLGTPITALFCGFLCALALLKKFDEETLSGWVGEGIKSAGTILAITGAGGAFGAVLKEANIAMYLGETLQTFNLGIILPFIIAAAIKTAQGSSTVALVTASAIVAPMLTGLGYETDVAKALVVMAIGAGSMTVSHANDSYFWVVTEFSGMKVSSGYKSQTMATLCQGVASIVFIFILSLFLL